MIKNLKPKIAVLIAAIMITVVVSAIMIPKAFGNGGPKITPTPTPTQTLTPTPTPTPPVSVITEVPRPANSLVIKNGYTSAPIYDWKTNKKIGTIYNGFTINIESQLDGKAFFILPILDKKNSDKSAAKKVYIPIKYLTKGYVEPQAVILMISLDKITIHKNAPIYDNTGKKIAVFTCEVGPMNFIQKTEKGYMLTLDSNVVFIRVKDAKFEAYKQK